MDALPENPDSAEASPALIPSMADLNESWARDFFGVIDSRNVDAIARHFDPAIVLSMGNSPKIRGLPAVRAAFEATQTQYSQVRHDIGGVWRGTQDAHVVLSVEAEVHYTLHDGRHVATPCTSTLKVGSAGIVEYRIFIDMAPLLQALTPRGGPHAVNVERFLQLLSAKRMDDWIELWDDDGMQVMPYSPSGFPKLVKGKQAIAQHYSGIPAAYGRIAFLDLTLYPCSDSDLVVAQFRGEIEVLATGRPYNNRYCCLFRFRQGRILEYVEYYDPTVLLYALGGTLQQTFNVNKDTP